MHNKLEYNDHIFYGTLIPGYILGCAYQHKTTFVIKFLPDIRHKNASTLGLWMTGKTTVIHRLSGRSVDFYRVPYTSITKLHSCNIDAVKWKLGSLKEGNSMAWYRSPWWHHEKMCSELEFFVLLCFGCILLFF